MTDQESIRSLDEIMSREPAADIVQEPNQPAQPETDEQGQPRDPAGKYAPKQPVADGADGDTDNAAQGAVEGGKPEKGFVPLQALHAERDKGKASRDEAETLRRQNAELIAALTRVQPQQQPQPAEKPKPKVFWEDPDAFLAERLSPIQQEATNRHMLTSRMLAVDKFGADNVKEADDALGAAMQANPNDPEVIALQQRVKNAEHPFAELVTWHQRRKAMADIGDDPEAFRTRERERLRQEILTEMGQPAAPTPAATPAAKPLLPSNFAGARSEGPRSAVTYSGPKPLSEITKGSAQ